MHPHPLHRDPLGAQVILLVTNSLADFQRTFDNNEYDDETSNSRSDRGVARLAGELGLCLLIYKQTICAGGKRQAKSSHELV